MDRLKFLLLAGLLLGLPGPALASCPGTIADCPSPSYASVAAGSATLGASTAAGATLHVTPGTAPASPQNGDIWIDSLGLYVRVGTGGTLRLLSPADLAPALPSGTSSQIYVGTGVAGAIAPVSTLPASAMPSLSSDVSNSGAAVSVNNLSHVTNGSLPNTGLVNSSVTVGGAACTLGGAACTPIATTIPGLFGDGSGGNVTCSGAVTLSADMNYNNLTVQAGCAINTAGFRISVAGTLDLSAAPAGAFYWNGNAGGTGGNASGASVGSAGAAGAALSTGTLSAGGSAGAGGVGAANANGANGNAGAVGNDGGSALASASAGTRSGSVGAAEAATWLGNAWPQMPFGMHVNSASSFGSTLGGSGSSGAPGGGSSTGSYAGGGGGGGASGSGVMFIAANIIARGTNATAGIIQAKGAAGGTGGGGSGLSTSCGGGGGGASGSGGGLVGIAFNTETGSTITGAIDVSGGAGGGGGNGGTASCTGGNGGGSGGSGGVLKYNFGAGTLTLTAPVAGSTGGAASGATGGTAASANTQQVNL